MNRIIAEFLFELALHGTSTALKLTTDHPIIFNPYHQYPKWQHSGLSPMDKRNIRQFGPGYNLSPQHTRSGLAVIASRVSPALAVIGAQVGAGIHIAQGGAEGYDLYTAPQRRRVEETGVSGVNLHYRSI